MLHVINKSALLSALDADNSCWNLLVLWRNLRRKVVAINRKNYAKTVLILTSFSLSLFANGTNY